MSNKKLSNRPFQKVTKTEMIYNTTSSFTVESKCIEPNDADCHPPLEFHCKSRTFSVLQNDHIIHDHDMPFNGKLLQSNPRYYPWQSNETNPFFIISYNQNKIS